MKTVLFDLDGTLLPMNQDVFIKAYFGGIATKMASYDYDPQQLIKGIWHGTECMIKNDGSITNETAFWNGFNQIFGRDCRKDEPIFDEFYHNEFRFVSASCGYDPQAAEIVGFLKQKGCIIVLATNPIFPAIATKIRMQWAGLKQEDFSLVTTYENSRYCKPNLDYYRDILKKIGEIPENCIMIGNDVGEDMIAGELGMEVFLLTDCMINKNDKDISEYSHGSFPELLDFLNRSV